MWEKFTFLRSWVAAELKEETFLGLPAVPSMRPPPHSRIIGAESQADCG